MSSQARNVMLAQKYDEKVDPTGWWMSEKLDGVRAYWSGSKFYSRQGNEFIAPSWFTKDLPREPLDGELWCGRGLFQKTLSIIKKTKDPERYAQDWKYVTYLVFDAPSRSDKGMKYEERVAWMESNIIPQSETSYAAVVGVCKCTGRDHLQKMLKQVLMKGGEGIMLRQPKSLYEQIRSHTLLKVKFFHDEEAKVIKHEKGSGRLQDLMGKLHCVLPNGVEFKVGTGFSDAQRRKPPKIGSVITFKYQEMSDNGHPRFPVFLRERGDMDWAAVLANAKTKAPFSSLKKKAVPLLQKQHSILFSTIPSRDQESGKKIVTANDADDDQDEAAAAGLLLTKGSSTHSKKGAGAAAAAGAKGKQICKWHPNCYQKNSAHLLAFDHPAPITGGSADMDEDDIPEGDAAEPRNKDMPDDPNDEDYSEKETKKKKRAKTPGVTSPSAAAPTAAASSSPASPTKGDAAGSPKVCWYGTACYNHDPDHLKRFSHPPKPAAPKTREEFIETTNQSQHDLAEYYQFGGDEDDDVVAAMLVADKNERRLSIQKYNENNKDGGAAVDLGEEDEAKDEEDVRTVIESVRRAHQIANGDIGYLQGCASDDDADEEKKTVAVADLPHKPASKGFKVSTAASTAATEVAPTAPRATRQASTRQAAASSSSSSKAAAVAPAPTGAQACVFLLPELLAKPARVIDTDDGEEICKKCKFAVSDHRERR